MKAVAIVAALATLALIAATLVPEAAQYQREATIAALVAGAVVLIAVIAMGSSKSEPEPKGAPAVAEAVKPAALPLPENQAEAEVASFLALLQEKGRLVDFLMDDVTPYADAQVGAAARVVHEGCRAVLKEHFSLRPVREEQEGSTVTVEAPQAADEYRLVGKITGQAPFTGRLIHRGWRVETIKLPRVLRPADDVLPTIAPAEIELS